MVAVGLFVSRRNLFERPASSNDTAVSEASDATTSCTLIRNKDEALESHLKRFFFKFNIL